MLYPDVESNQLVSHNFARDSLDRAAADDAIEHREAILSLSQGPPQHIESKGRRNFQPTNSTA